MGRKPTWILLLALAGMLLVVDYSSAQGMGAPSITIGVGSSSDPADVSKTLQVLFLLTILSLAPSILIMTTSFTRIVIILSFMRRALGTQQTPSNQIVVGLSLFLTFFIMTPVWDQIRDEALNPYLEGKIKAEQVTETNSQGETITRTVEPFNVALGRATEPMRDFMWKQLGRKGTREVALFLYLAKMDPPETRAEVPTRILIPAFVVSEMQKAFIAGFVLFIPFLIIDMVIASALMSMGMMMLPPVTISFPFKILLFVMVDGWHLLIYNIGLSFVP